MTPAPFPQQRYPEIDLVRTVAILGMITYHTLFMGWYFFDWNINPLGGWQWTLARITSNTFLLLVGISFVLASQKKHTAYDMWKRAFRRGAIVFGAGLLVTAVTYVFLPKSFIQFGILHCIGISMMLLPAFRPFKEWNLFVGFVLIIIGVIINPLRVDTVLLMPLGIPQINFQTLDYFPLLPNFGIILIGLAIGQLLFERFHCEPLINTKKIRLITWPGRHSLVLYLIHPVIVYGILKLTNSILSF